MSYDGEERRNPDRPSDLAFSLGKIITRIESLEKDFKLYIENEDKRHTDVERTIISRISNEIQLIYNKLDILSSGNASVNLTLQKISLDDDDIQRRIISLEDAGKNRVWKLTQEIGKKLIWFALTVIGLALLYTFTKTDFIKSLLIK